MSVDHAELVERLKGTARDLVSLIAGADAAAMARRPAPREWSADMIVAHLADTELVHAVRIRLVVAEERPLLVAFDEGAWAERFGTLDPDARESLHRWRTVREATIRVLESLEPAEWERAGMHEERGVMTVAAIVKVIGDHDKAHLDQIRATLATRP